MFETKAPEQDGLTLQTLMWVSLQTRTEVILQPQNWTAITEHSKHPWLNQIASYLQIKSNKFLHQLKFAKRSKNYTAVYKEYHQTEALIQGQLEQELKQVKLESLTWIEELEGQHNWQLTHDKSTPERN